MIHSENLFRQTDGKEGDNSTPPPPFKLLPRQSQTWDLSALDPPASQCFDSLAKYPFSMLPKHKILRSPLKPVLKLAWQLLFILSLETGPVFLCCQTVIAEASCTASSPVYLSGFPKPCRVACHYISSFFFLNFLLVLCDSHIMHPNPTHLPVSSYLLSALATSPNK